MIKCNIKKGGKVRVSAHGEVGELTTETLVLIQAVYQGLKSEKPYAADLFRRSIIGSVLDPNSPVWGDGPPELKVIPK